MVDAFHAEFRLSLLDRLPQAKCRKLEKQEIHIEIILEIFSIRERHEFVDQDVSTTVYLDVFNDHMPLKREKWILCEFHFHGPPIVIVKQKQPAIVFALMLDVDHVWNRSEETEDRLKLDLLLGKEVEVFRISMPKVEC